MHLRKLLCTQLLNLDFSRMQFFISKCHNVNYLTQRIFKWLKILEEDDTEIDEK